MALTVADLIARDRTWSLDDFVAEVNRLLPMIMPDGSPGRAKAEMNARLVRHYATEGVLPKPLKQSGEAQYGADHLVRALALRRLLADGYPSGVAGTVLARHDTEALARLLVGELRVGVDLEPDVVAAPVAHPVAHLSEGVRERLADLRRRAGLPPLGAPPSERAERTRSAPPRREVGAPPRGDAEPAPLLHRRSLEGEAWSRQVPRRVTPTARASSEGGVAWTRYPLVEGLELHVRDDFDDPPTPAARERLRDVLLARLEAIALERGGRRR
ncbi:MAG: MerR family transcriptional regulator [Trueperaceae bacterium]